MRREFPRTTACYLLSVACPKSYGSTNQIQSGLEDDYKLNEIFSPYFRHTGAPHTSASTFLTHLQELLVATLD